MSINRIQKLLFSEYCDFEDMVLVESPFAQTTREGMGIRQVHLGLTPTKLVLAADVLPPVHVSSVIYLPGVDPDIETFEKRQSLKAHFCNDRILYFELGGFVKRNMFWNLWCERVKFLNPEDPGSSRSETSVATSTSNSTLYLVDTKKVITESGLQQLWCQFSCTDPLPPKWCDRYLYMGNQLSEPPTNYTPVMNRPTASEFISKRYKPKGRNPRRRDLSQQILSRPRVGSINRFGSGIAENCKSGLFLQTIYSAEDSFASQSSICLRNEADYAILIENAVLMWELSKNKNVQTTNRHRRRYGIAPQPHFLYGFGPWSISPGEKCSLQMKRAVSAVRIRRQPVESELRLVISKRHLASSISCEALHSDNQILINNSGLRPWTLKKPILFFWTPDYWYRPRLAKDAYHELTEHLNRVRENCQSLKDRRKPRFRRGTFFTERRSTIANNCNTDGSGERTSRDDKLNLNNSTKEETSVQFLREILKLNISFTTWDFDSTTLAYQLTIIDRDLFLKISPPELGLLIWRQTSKNAPNIGAFIAFSHRISCLVATEVLRDDTDKIRARLISRFINTAEKCHKLSNFQSCRSILCGLQSLAVYRLHRTWGYVRKRHATKYQVFECMCRLYKDPRLPNYRQVFAKKAQTPPYLPSLVDLLLRLLHPLSDAESRNTYKSLKENTTNNSKSLRTIKKLLSTLRMLQSDPTVKTPLVDVTDIYDSRVIRLEQAVEFLERGQKAAEKYIMKGNELAEEYLLKARYREESENFFNSFTIERPM